MKIFALLFICALGACNSKKKENTLIVLTSADNPPYEFMDTQNNKIVGFEVDLVNEVARRMKMDVELKDISFSTIIPALQSGKGDVAMAAISKTPERAQAVDFSQGYHESIPTILSKEPINARSYKGLNGKKIGVQLGSAYDIAFKNLILEEPSFKVQITSLSGFGELVQELKKGKIDCIITEGVVAQNFIKDGLLSMPLMDQQIDSYCAIFPKGSNISDKFGKILDVLKKEGFIDRLIQKWLATPMKMAAK
jgi:ABC-type amino acid transport substrate-binding protein